MSAKTTRKNYASGASLVVKGCHNHPCSQPFLVFLVADPPGADSLSQLRIHFWFFPGTNKVYEFSWYLQGQGKLWDGVGCSWPARNFGSLRSIWLGEVTSSSGLAYCAVSHKLICPPFFSYKDMIRLAGRPEQPPIPVAFFDHTVIHNWLRDWILWWSKEMHVSEQAHILSKSMKNMMGRLLD